MAFIEGGSFGMGAHDLGEDEAPVHPVTVAGLCIDKVEVTVAAYRACVASGGCTPAGTGQGCNGDDQRDHPVNCVDWNQADAFCRASGKRLPSEEEWEFAARGPCPWGEDAPRAQLCWDGDGRERATGTRTSTCPVGSFHDRATPEGVLDLAGNVWEWTASGYCMYPPEGTRPSCPSEARVLRGGSWSNFARVDVRTAGRVGFSTDHRSRDVGFRCVD